MDAAADRDDEMFRAEVRDFLRDNLPPDMAERNLRAVHQTREDTLDWTAILARKGWSVPKWPVEHGGAGWSARKLAVFEEELDLAGAPATNIQGVSLVGPVIYTFGNEAQKARYLPRIRNGEEFWSQGFSEPNSGSDLASLRTRALRDGDHYIVNGQKIWTSESMMADMCFVLVRTDPDVKPQLGISFILVPLTSPGVAVRPIRSIDEGESLCEVFFEDVRVPAENLVGQEGKGWDYAKFLLANERTATAEVPRNKRLLARLKKIAAAERVKGRSMLEDPLFRHHIAELEIDLVALEAGVARVLDGDANPLLPSILKIQGCELLQAIQKAQVEALGPYGVAYFPQGHDLPGAAQTPPAANHARDVVADFLFRRAATIYGGSNEIQKNIVSKVLLAGGAPSNGAARDEDRAMLAGSAARFLEKTYAFDQRKAMRQEGVAAQRRNWSTFADLGWLGLSAPEASGGLGADLQTAAILLEAFGRALVLEPYLSCALFAGRLIEKAAAPTRATALLGQLISGEMIFAVAYDEPEARGALDSLAASARRDGDHFVLNGAKCVIHGGQTADVFLVAARLSGAVGDALALFAVDRATAGLTIKPYRLVDGTLVADLHLDNVRVDRAARLDGDGARAALTAAIDEATIGACAEAVGAMDEVLKITRDYILIRKQFGATLSSFQALQHRLAEMYGRIEQARAIVAMAFDKVTEAAPDERRRIVNAAKAAVGRCAFFVGAQGVQLHGGIGMTEDYAVGHYFKRLLTFETSFGGVRAHTEEFARTMKV